MASLIRRSSLRRRSQKKKRTPFTKEVAIHDVIRKGNVKDLERVFCCSSIGTRSTTHTLRDLFSRGSSDNGSSSSTTAASNTHRPTSPGNPDMECVNCDVNQELLGGRTPLHLAVDTGKIEVVEFLVEHGANVDKEDNSGWTPLHRAIGGGWLNVVKYLLSHDANPCRRMPDGSLPLTIALERRDIALVSALISSSRHEIPIICPLTDDISMASRHRNQTPTAARTSLDACPITRRQNSSNQAGSGGVKRAASFTSGRTQQASKAGTMVTAAQLIAQYSEHQKASNGGQLQPLQAREPLTAAPGQYAVAADEKHTSRRTQANGGAIGFRRVPVKVWRTRTNSENAISSPASSVADNLANTALSPALTVTAPSFDEGFAEQTDSDTSRHLSDSVESAASPGNTTVVIDYFQRGTQRGSSFRRAFTAFTRRQSRSLTPSPVNSPSKHDDAHSQLHSA